MAPTILDYQHVPTVNSFPIVFIIVVGKTISCSAHVQILAQWLFSVLFSVVFGRLGNVADRITHLAYKQCSSAC